jgi:hypothetical protein
MVKRARTPFLKLPSLDCDILIGDITPRLIEHHILLPRIIIVEVVH